MTMAAIAREELDCVRIDWRLFKATVHSSSKDWFSGACRHPNWPDTKMISLWQVTDGE